MDCVFLSGLIVSPNRKEAVVDLDLATVRQSDKVQLLFIGPICVQHMA